MDTHECSTLHQIAYTERAFSKKVPCSTPFKVRSPNATLFHRWIACLSRSTARARWLLSMNFIRRSISTNRACGPSLHRSSSWNVP
jgi:hypothetical protein